MRCQGSLHWYARVSTFEMRMHLYSTRFLLLFGCMFWLASASSQSLRLNEVVSSNKSGLRDEDGDFSDWIEVFNATNQPIDLGQYVLSDDEMNPLKWTFPSLTLGQAEYLIIFASGKNTNAGDNFHANFRIAAGGESLLLSKLNGELVDQVTLPPLGDDVAFARIGNSSANWKVTTLPTPRALNLTNRLTFSHEEGFYERPFQLSIEGDSFDKVYFTRNGNMPTPLDEEYTGSLFIDSRVGDPNVVSEIVTTASSNDLSYQGWESPAVELHKGHVLRFASYDSGQLTSPVYTKTYFADGKLNDRYSVPVVSLVVDSNSLFHYDTGIHVTGVNLDESTPIDIEFSGNSFMRGRDWERDTHFSFFELNGSLGVSQAAGLRIHGGKTRQAAQKSFRLYARSAYGKSTFEHQFLKTRDHESYKRLVLRTSVGAWKGPSIINDVLANRIVKGLNFESQENRPVVVYLNGEYWGLYTLTDRIDENFLAYEVGVDADAVDIWDWSQGDYYELVDFAEENDLSIDANYQFVLDQVDIDNFIDYHIAQQFFANLDWPANNSAHWRRKPNEKWRWIFYDLDAGLSFPEQNMFEHMMFEAPADGSFSADRFASTLYRNLLDNEIFRARYTSRFSELLSKTFSKDSTLVHLSQVMDEYESEISLHAERWGDPVNEFEWKDVVADEIAAFLVSRPCIVRGQLQDFFDLDHVDFDCNSTFLQDEISISPNPSNGIFEVQNESSRIGFISEVYVFNTIGHLVFAKAGEVLMPGGKFQLRLSDVANGFYILTFVMNGERVEKRIIISGK